MKRNKGYSKKKKREVEANIRELIGKDFSDYEIQEALNLQPHVLRHYKKQIYGKDKIQFQNMTPESVLANFAEMAKENIAQLEELNREGRKSGKLSAAHVQAVKLQHRLENQVIKHAQSFGLLPKRSMNLELADMHFQKHSMKDIRAAVQVEANNILADVLGDEE